MKLEAGQVAVVTGAANGIGRALAAEIVARGLRVVVADIENAPLSALAAELGDAALAVPTDVADPDQVRALAERTLAAFGRVDLVVNNAGISEGGPSWALEPAQWRRVWSVNVEGVVHGIAAFVPHLIAAGSGHVVNLSSVAGLDTAAPFGAPYSASKHAVLAISEGLRTELELLAPAVRVTTVCPGPIDTRMMRGLFDAVEAAEAEDPAEARPAAPVAPPELAEKLTALAAGVTAMRAELMPAEQAARIVLDAVEADRRIVSTHPGMARDAARRQYDAVVESLDIAESFDR